MRKWVCMWLAAAMALGCAACAGAEEAERPFDNWYEIFVRSYQDSDGDGLGDLNGVLQRLDYIEGLNMTGIWLMPIMPSPSYHKYDVTDYMAVDREYGTVDDFKALAEAIKASPLIRDCVLIGDTAEQIRAELDRVGYQSYVQAGYDFDRCLALCRELAQPGGCVLLSPACASFDMFRDYEDRGRIFKAKVMAMT